MIYEGAGFTDAQQSLETEASLEAETLSTKRLFQKLHARAVDDVRITSLYRVLWKLPHLLSPGDHGLQYIGRNILLRSAGFRCGPNIRPLPASYKELLESAKNEPLITFLLRLSYVPNKEITIVGLQVLLQILSFDLKHMKMIEIVTFCGSVGRAVQDFKSSENLLPVLLVARELSNRKPTIPWFRKPFLEVYFESLCFHIENEAEVPEKDLIVRIRRQLGKGKNNKIEGWEIETEKRRFLAEQESSRDAACLLCDSLANLVGDPIASQEIAGGQRLIPYIFNLIQMKTATEVINVAIFDLLWRLSFSKPSQDCVCELMYNDLEVYNILLDYCAPESFFLLQAVGVLWNCLGSPSRCMKFQTIFENAANRADSRQNDPSSRNLTRNNLLYVIVVVVNKSDDLDVLSVACGLCSQLLYNDYNVFYMSQQGGFMDRLVDLAAVNTEGKGRAMAVNANRALIAARH